MENITIEVAIGLMLVAIGGILMLLALMYCLFERHIDELQHDVEQLKHDSESNAHALRAVTCAVANLESRSDEENKRCEKPEGWCK